MKSRILLISIVILLVGCISLPENAEVVDSQPRIYPDYLQAEIPVNIAPLNFKMVEKCQQMVVLFTGKNSRFQVSGKQKIEIPLSKWRKMLAESKDDSVKVQVFASFEGKWKQYQPFAFYVRPEPVDPYLAYRLIAPGYVVWSKMGIYQRNLTNFEQEAIITNSLVPGACMNCHAFRQNSADSMIFHLRVPNGGTVLLQGDVVEKLATKTDQTISNFVYPYWHPGGDYIVFSVNNISQVFHATAQKRIEVVDAKSDIIVYDIRNNKVLTCDFLTTPDFFETFPAFTPNGKNLVFCRAEARETPGQYDSIKYNLCAVAFDPATGHFGNRLDTLVAAAAFNKSVSFPRVSPDGKYLMFTLSDYGNFSIWHNEADLYLLNLSDKTYRALDEVNSPRTESYHSWSSNSRWFVFSSRRDDGLYTRPYLSYVDETGRIGKPFMLPQKDPDFYTDLMESFNIPEFVKGEVNINSNAIERLLYQGVSKQVEATNELGSGHY